jgi:hypothetical protein
LAACCCAEMTAAMQPSDMRSKTCKRVLQLLLQLLLDRDLDVDLLVVLLFFGDDCGMTEDEGEPVVGPNDDEDEDEDEESDTKAPCTTRKPPP